MTDTEVVAEGELREWATAHKNTAKTIDLLAKDGFSSMDAVELLDKEDLSVKNTARPAETSAEGPAAQASEGGRADDGSHRDNNGGDGHVRGWRNSPSGRWGEPASQRD